MFWGRNSLYKVVFHTIIIFLSFLALSSGLANRISAAQKHYLRSNNIDALLVDNDFVTQQGKKFPIIDQDRPEDSLYLIYTVKTNDTLNSIAQSNSINIDTIRWANNIPSNKNELNVGQQINIPIIDGVLYKVNEGDTITKILAKVQNGGDMYTILGLNSQAIDNKGNFIPGSIILLPNASLLEVSNSKTSPTKQPQLTFISQQHVPIQNLPPGTFINPLRNCNYRFGRGFVAAGMYKHTGIDLVTAEGCIVQAAGNGTILYANYCSITIGYCVVIAHPNGDQTIYGHGNGVMYVVVGQQLTAGQNIMQSGCSGKLCFGPHVHISLTINNQDVFGCLKCRIDPAGIIPY